MPRDLKLEWFMEAVYNQDAQLSYHALVGTRKPSVSDVSQIFSSTVLDFFQSQSYTVEAEYVQIILNWRRACDERGLSDAQRSQYMCNNDFLNYVLDELMPWHKCHGINSLSIGTSVYWKSISKLKFCKLHYYILFGSTLCSFWIDCIFF